MNQTNQNKINPVNLTKELLQIPSESGGEKAIGEFIVKLLKDDFEITKQMVGNRFNILAVKGKPKTNSIKLLLATHIDTVPKQLEVKEDSEFLYGCGACDTKGIIAAMICASKEAISQGITNFGLLFDVSEETDFSGIKEAINLVNPKTVIIGEPTKLKIVTGQKGTLEIKISSVGKSCHSSIPENGVSAIENLLELLKKIKLMPLPIENKLGKTTINIGKISGGTAANIVPDYAEAIIEIRTTRENKKILGLITNIIRKENIAKKNISKENCVLLNYELLYSFEPAIIKNKNITNKLAERFGLETATVPYFTEMYFWSKKSNTFVFGPGNLEFAHTDEERISKADLLNGTKLYLEIIRELTK